MSNPPTPEAVLFFSDGRQIAIDRDYLTVGNGMGFDFDLGAQPPGVLFAIRRQGAKYQLLPGTAKVHVNGKAVSKSSPLVPCDRITGDRFTACLGARTAATAPASNPGSAVANRALAILENTAADFEEDPTLQVALERVLIAIVEVSGAEQGYLISEIDPERRTEWAVVAGFGAPVVHDRRREIVSSTVLNEAVKRRETVAVESLIGHPWERNTSLLGARLASVACIPLALGPRVFGAVYLCSHSPSRQIKPGALRDLGVLATQIALLMAVRDRLRSSRAPAETTPSSSGPSAMVLDAPVMRQLRDRLQKLAVSDLNVLIRGETGTGKELLAAELHQRSARAKGPFVVVNCAAIPSTLIESVLFGHVKGAFTGAVQSRPGKFRQAHGGTVFLDEIGDLPLDLQARLLRVLQEHEIEAVGSDEATPVDFRVVAATHQDLEAAVQSGKFRKDLFFRLNGATLGVPPLRERGPDEITLLARHFLKSKYPGKAFSEAALRRLENHSWPGNVRELEQVISRAAALAPNPILQSEDLEIESTGAPALAETVAAAPTLAASLRQGQSAFTRSLVDGALHRNQGNRALTARHLGISERTLYRILADRSDSAS